MTATEADTRDVLSLADRVRDALHTVGLTGDNGPTRFGLPGGEPPHISFYAHTDTGHRWTVGQGLDLARAFGVTDPHREYGATVTVVYGVTDDGVGFTADCRPEGPVAA